MGDLLVAWSTYMELSYYMDSWGLLWLGQASSHHKAFSNPHLAKIGKEEVVGAIPFERPAVKR